MCPQMHFIVALFGAAECVISHRTYTMRRGLCDYAIYAFYGHHYAKRRREDTNKPTHDVDLVNGSSGMQRSNNMFLW